MMPTLADDIRAFLAEQPQTPAVEAPPSANEVADFLAKQPAPPELPKLEYVADWVANKGYEAGLSGPTSPLEGASRDEFLERFKYAKFDPKIYRDAGLWDIYQKDHAEGLKPENRGPFQKAQEYARFKMPWERQAIAEEVQQHAVRHGLDPAKQMEKFQRYVSDATTKKDRSGIGITAQALGLGLEQTYEGISGFIQGTLPDLVGQVYRLGPGALTMAGEAIKDVTAGKSPMDALGAEGAAKVNAEARQVADAVREHLQLNPDAHVAHMKALQTMHAKDPRFQGRQGVGGWIEDAFYGAVQMAPAWGASYAMTAAGGGTIAPVAFWTMIEGGGAYQEFREQGIPHEDAALAAPIVGVFNGALEVMQIQVRR